MGFLPYLSDNGPAINWKRAKVIENAVKVRLIAVLLTCRAFICSGTPGK